MLAIVHSALGRTAAHGVKLPTQGYGSCAGNLLWAFGIALKKEYFQRPSNNSLPCMGKKSFPLDFQ